MFDKLDNKKAIAFAFYYNPLEESLDFFLLKDSDEYENLKENKNSDPDELLIILIEEDGIEQAIENEKFIEDMLREILHDKYVKSYAKKNLKFSGMNPLKNKARFFITKND